MDEKTSKIIEALHKNGETTIRQAIGVSVGLLHDIEEFKAQLMLRISKDIMMLLNQCPFPFYVQYEFKNDLNSFAMMRELQLIAHITRQKKVKLKSPDPFVVQETSEQREKRLRLEKEKEIEELIKADKDLSKRLKEL